MKKNNNKLSYCLILLLCFYPLNSLEIENYWLINKINTSFILENYKLFQLNNLTSMFQKNNISEASIKGDNIDYTIKYLKNGLVDRIFQKDEIISIFYYENNHYKIEIKEKDLNGAIKSYGFLDKKKKELLSNIILNFTKSSSKDTISFITKLESNGNYCVINRGKGYSKYDSNLNLLEIGYKNLRFLDFLIDNYYPFLKIDYLGDTVNTSFYSDVYFELADGFALDYWSFSTIYLDDSTAIIKRPKSDEVDEKIYFNDKNLPTKVIKYHMHKDIDSIMFDYKYYSE